MDEQQAPLSVEEVEVEREAHPEGVDRGAAGDQKPGANPLARQQCQAQQAGAETGGNPHLADPEAAPGQAGKTGSEDGGHERQVETGSTSPPGPEGGRAGAPDSSVQMAVQGRPRTGTGLR